MTKRKMFLSVIIVVTLLIAVNMQLTSAKVGTGELYVYEDSDYTQLVDTDDHGFYEVNPGQTVYIEIVNIEADFDWVQVRVSYEEIPGEATELGIFQVLAPGRHVGDPDHLIEWSVPPEAVVCFTYVVQYRHATAPPNPAPIPGAVYIACSPGIRRPAHLHITPEYPIGTLGAVAVLLASFGIYRVIKNRKAIPAPKF